jgi:GcrA cell cycle regulator
LRVVTPNSPWTDDVAARARALWDEGVSSTDIGRRVGRSGNAVVGYAHRHGWPPHPHQPLGAEWRAQRKAGVVPRRAPKPAVAVPEPPHRDTLWLRASTRPEPLAAPTTAFRGCQWSDSEKRPWRFCEAPVSRDSAYCEAHFRRCYYHPHARRAEAA